jgi:phosphoribosylaminoimidazole-succinocarboxamide synthase
MENLEFDIDPAIDSRFGDIITDAYKADDLDYDLGDFNKDIKLIHKGKVRDSYLLSKGDKNKRLMLATDRLSAFDRAICKVPFKGQLLNQLSAWWFNNTKDIVANHCITMPNPRMILCENIKVLPVEVVVRSYLTGSTNTAIWTRYNNGERNFFGNNLKDNLPKNSKLPEPILDPTSKSDIHDEPMSIDDIKAHPQIAPYWEQISQVALDLFKFGQQTAKDAGLILVDTKYEFGITDDNRLVLIDECHTSDSSRYWNLKSWEEDIANPKAYDKELMRLWVRERCDPYKDKNLPKIPLELVKFITSQYIDVYERITNLPFVPDESYGKEAINNMKDAAIACLDLI